MKAWIRDNSLVVLSITILAVVTAVTLGLFFVNFNTGFSTNQQDWGALGSYLSGTIGITIALFAVVWLIKSVQIQKSELAHLKNELHATGEEQKKQTQINALSALIQSSQSAMNILENKLVAMNSGDKHLHPLEDERIIHDEISKEYRKIEFYKKQLESQLLSVYVDNDVAGAKGIVDILDENEEL